MASKGNSLIEQRMKKRQEDEYQKRLKNVKGQLDLTPPRNNLHLRIQLNKLHIEQEQQAAIDKQNLVIIEKLAEIKKSPGRIDNLNKNWKPSNDRLKKFRERRQRRIEQENRLLAERLKKVHSYYDSEEWEKDYQKHLYYMSMMENTTKDHDYVEYKDDEPEKSSLGNSSDGNEGEDETDSLPPVPPGTPEKDKNKKSSDDDEDNISLPPIDDKQGKKKDDHKDEGYSEQDAIMDAEELRAAIKDDNKDKILEILGKTSEREKLQELRDKYQEMYDKDPMEDVKPSLDKEAQSVLQSLSSSAAQEDARRLNEATKGLGTDEDTIIEILCTRNNKEMEAIRDEYNQQFDRSLEEDLKGDTSGDVEKILVELSKGQREETEEVDKNVAKRDAENLIEAGVGSWGTDEGEFIRIFTQRSLPQLAAMYPEYYKLAKMDIEESIDNEMDGDLQKTFLALVKHSRNPSGAQEEKINKAIKDGDTGKVARIILPMNKGQLDKLCSAYRKNNKVDLADDVDKKCSGDLKQMLLAKLGKEADEKKKEKEKVKKENKGRSKEGEKLPAIVKKKEQEKKSQKKQEKKSETAKEEQDTSQKDVEELHQAIQGKDSTQHKGNQPGKGKDGPKEKGKQSPAKQASPGKKQTEATKGKKEDETSQLYKAIQAEDKKKIKDIVVRNATDKPKLKKLSDDYKKQHKKHLVEALESNIDDDLHEAITALLLPPSQADARRLHSAMEGLGTDEGILIEILCSRSNAEIENIKKDYKKQYSKSLEEDVKSETSGDFEKLLVALLQGQRDESTSVNDDQAHKDAETLIEAGIKSWGTDEDKFIDIFTTRSIPQLRAMLPEYSKWATCDIEESITSELDGDLQAGLLTLVACIRDPGKNQVDKLHAALLDGDNGTVARIIAGSNEASLKKLESTYNTNYSPKLFNEVDKKCSPELKKILLPKLKDKNQEKTANNAKAAEPKKQSGASPTKKKDEKEKEDVCTQLHAAIDKKDKKKIKEIVLRHAVDKNKIKKLSDDYQQLYDKNLVDELDSKMEDDLHEAITAMLLPTYQADARTLFYAMKGIGTKENLLMEILCTRSNEEIRDIKSEYTKKYGRSLEEDVKGDTSDDFEKLLTELLKGARDESTDLDEELVEKDATELHNAGVKIWGTDEDKFIEILTTRSSAHLKAMMAEYTKLSGVDLEESIKDEMDGDLQDGLIMLLSCIRDEAKAMADQLYTALQDHDTMTVARIIVATDQDKMTDIETSYNLHHKPKIFSEVNKKCSEDLKKIILPKLKDKKLEKEKLAQPQKAGGRKQSIFVKKQPSKNTPATAGAIKEKGEDCSLLYRAIKNNEKKKITEIVVRNSTDKSKMQKLSDDYSKRYKKNLVDELDSKMEDDVHEAMTALLLPPFQASARSLYYAMKGIGNHELHLIQVLCTKSNAEMIEIKKEYQKKYGRSLDEDVKYQTSGDLETLLTALIKGIRDDSTKVNQELAREDATELHNAGVKKWGTDEDKFIEILTTRSSAHLKAMMAEYTKLSGVDLEESIKDEMDGDLQDGLIMLLSCIRDEGKAMADQLYTALQDHDTMTVARIIVATDQDKLSAIESSYSSIHKQSLYKEVDEKCSDDLKKIILPKLEAEDQKKKDVTSGRFRKISQGGQGRGSVKSNSRQSENNEKEENKKESNKGRPKLDIKKVEYHGTVVANKNFDALRSAERLKKAMKGFGSDEGTIISVLTSCTSLQRQEIAEAFREQYEKDLVDELKSELSGNFEDAIVGLMSTPAVYDANMLYSAMKGIGTQESVLTEIICSCSNKEIEEIKEAYKAAYGKDVTQDVEDETSGDFRSVLMALLQGKRGRSDNTDEEEAYKDAQRLLEAGEKKWGTDESVFIDILTTKSLMQLRAVFQAYKHVSNKEILESVDEELGGDFHDAVRAIVLCASDPPRYFAECLHSAMSGMMTSNATVTRIIITRSEIDLKEIKSAYIQQFGKTLESQVRDTLKGDQEGLLLKLLGE